MIRSVRFDHTEYAPPPHKFEAGTPPIVEVIGLGAALDWLEQETPGLAALAAHEEQLRAQCEADLKAIPGLKVIGSAPGKAAVVSFVVEGIHAHDLGTFLDQFGVAVRVGQHCAEPVMRFFGLPATVRASFAAYNGEDDVAQLGLAVRETLAFFG